MKPKDVACIFCMIASYHLIMTDVQPAWARIFLGLIGFGVGVVIALMKDEKPKRGKRKCA